MTEATRRTGNELDMALTSARQTLTLLRSQAQAGKMDLHYLDQRLDAVEKLMNEVSEDRKVSVQQERLGKLYDFFFQAEDGIRDSSVTGVQTCAPIYVLAVYSAASEAVERARAGEGPTLIESVTYRMSFHNTTDNPSLYEDPKQRDDASRRDPIDRVVRYLTRRALWDKERDKETRASG